jgi:zinc protease
MRATCSRAGAVALLIATAVACASARRAPQGEPGVRPSDEDSVLLPVSADPTVTFKVWFKVGSQHDPAGKEGLAYLTAQLLAQGATTRHSYEQILEKLYPLASSYDVRIDREMTVLTGRTHRDNVERFLELFEDAYLRPAFAEVDYKRVQTDTLNYLRNTLRYESDEELAKAALYGFVFEGTRYAHPAQGTVRGVESATLEDVRRFYERHYTRDNAVVALGGGFDEALADRARARVRELPAGQPPAVAVPHPARAGGRQLLLVAKPGADASISLGFPIETLRGEPDFYALWLANSWLGEHRNSSSHLFQVIREARGMNYGDYSYIEVFPEGGRRNFPPSHAARHQQLFEIWIRTLPNRQAHFALRAALRELETLVDRGLSREQFELTRSFLRKYVLHFAETTTQRLGYAVDDRFYGISGEGHLDRFRRTMDELTLEQVNAAVRRHLRPEHLKIAIVTGEAESLRTALGTEAPSPMQYETAKPPEVLAEDEQIASYPLRIDAGSIRIVPVERIFEQ